MATNKEAIHRRDFFSYLAVGWIAFGAAIGGLLTLVFRFTYPNVSFDPPTDFVAGKPDEYEEGVDERWKNQFGVWIIKEEGKIVALSNICTHLGCIPNWISTARKFKCPCHGSGFYSSGINFEGPAPRPLERYKISLNDQGKLVVDKSKVYRYEKDQWESPESFVRV